MLALIDLRLFSVLVIVGLCSSADPGVKVRVTKNGVNAASQIAHDMIVQQLQTLSIPDQSGSSGHLSYTLSSIDVKDVTPPGSSITLVPNDDGLTWSLTNFGIHIYANWKAKYEEGIIKISDSGTLDLTVSEVNLDETAAFGIDQTGRPSIFSVNCDASIGKVDVDFHGGTAFILNLFKGPVEDKIKDVMKPQICDEVVELINVDGEQALATLPVTVEFAKDFLLDYSLTAAPSVTDDYVEIFDKGEIYWEADPQESPYVPQVLPAWSDNSRMVYIWVTAYSPNTFFYQAHTHDYLKYNVTRDDLPPENIDFFNTTCGLLMCIGSIIPEIGEMYPNSVVELRVQTSAVPNATATPSAIYAQIAGPMDMYAHTPDGQVAYLMTVNVNTSFTVEASIVEQKLSGKIIDHSFSLTLVKSAVGNLSESVVSIAFDGILTLGIIPEINDIIKEGVVLPMVEGVQFYNTTLILQDGNIVIGTDLQYQVNKDERFKVKVPDQNFNKYRVKSDKWYEMYRVSQKEQYKVKSLLYKSEKEVVF